MRGHSVAVCGSMLKISFRICSLYVLEYDITVTLSTGVLPSKLDLPY